MALLFGRGFRRGSYNRGVNLSKESKLYRTVNAISILGVFVAIVLCVLGAMQIIKFNRILIGVIATIGALCVGSVLMLPWIRCLDHKENKIVSLVFIALDALVPLLWIISIWIIVGVSAKGEISLGLLNFIKAVLIISVQFGVASYIASGITKYKKSMLVLQVIAYVCYLYVDFIATYFLCCLNFSGKNLLVDHLSLFNNVWIWALFVISIAFISVANLIMYRDGINRVQQAAEEVYAEKAKKSQEETQKPQTETVEEQLEKLKLLLDKNLITQEEYDKKREDIISKM